MEIKNDYEIRTLKIGVLIKKQSIFHDSLTEIEIIDEGSGEFVSIRQMMNDAEGSIRIDIHEWETLKRAIEEMISECRREDDGFLQ